MSGEEKGPCAALVEARARRRGERRVHHVEAGGHGHTSSGHAIQPAQIDRVRRCHVLAAPISKRTEFTAAKAEHDTRLRQHERVPRSRRHRRNANAAQIVGVEIIGVLNRNGPPDLAFARSLADAVGPERVIAAVDSKGGRVVIRGWTEPVDVTAAEAARALEPYCGEFLYTHVDREGLMSGTDMTAVQAVAQATSRPVTAAGGITTREEIDTLDAAGIDAVVGMALYTGTLSLNADEDNADRQKSVT